MVGSDATYGLPAELTSTLRPGPGAARAAPSRREPENARYRHLRYYRGERHIREGIKNSSIKIHWDGNIRTNDNSTSGVDVVIEVYGVSQQCLLYTLGNAPNGTVSAITDVYVEKLAPGSHTVSVTLNAGGHPTTLSPDSAGRKPWLLEVFENGKR